MNNYNNSEELIDEDNNGAWKNWTTDFFDEEKVVFKTNLPLVLTSSLITGVYSYFVLKRPINGCVNRALLMALSTFLGASAVDLLQNQGLVDKTGNASMAIGTLTVPLIYFWVNSRQFKMPEVNSESLKTGFISAITAQLATPFVSKYMDQKKKSAKPE